MTQPAQVPQAGSDRVRPSSLLPPPRHWVLDRPGDALDHEAPVGPRFGTPGPDLGYGLKLAHRLEPQLVLTEGEHVEDAVAGGFACGARRAAFFGRAPVIYDMQWAFGLWGYLDPAPEDLVQWRRPLFRGAAEDYWEQRRIVDAVKVETLRMTPAAVRAKLSNWKDFLIV